MKREVIELVVNVNDIITPTSCAKMIIELIKFIIYQTELIPYPYERLKMCINKHKELELITNGKQIDDQVTFVHKIPFEFRKCFKMAQEAYDSLENLFTHIKTELISDSCSTVDEITIILGSSLVFPENVFRIKVPKLDLIHLSKYHSLRKNLECLFRSIFASDEFHNSISRNKCKSNLYVLFGMKGAFIGDRTSFFIPRYNFKLPTKGQHAVISFSSLSEKRDCLCTSFIVHRDNDNDDDDDDNNDISSFDDVSSSEPTQLLLEDDNKSLNGTDICLNSNDDGELTWFQVKNPVKSFADFKFNGLSLYDVCVNSSKNNSMK